VSIGHDSGVAFAVCNWDHGSTPLKVIPTTVVVRRWGAWHPLTFDVQFSVASSGVCRGAVGPRLVCYFAFAGPLSRSGSPSASLGFSFLPPTVPGHLMWCFSPFPLRSFLQSSRGPLEFLPGPGGGLIGSSGSCTFTSFSWSLYSLCWPWCSRRTLLQVIVESPPPSTLVSLFSSCPSGA